MAVGVTSMGFWGRGHITQVRRQADGTYVSECACGWVSAPAGHRDELGWACARALAQQAVNDTAWTIVTQTVRGPQ